MGAYSTEQFEIKQRQHIMVNNDNNNNIWNANQLNHGHEHYTQQQQCKGNNKMVNGSEQQLQRQQIVLKALNPKKRKLSVRICVCVCVYEYECSSVCVCKRGYLVLRGEK